MIQIIPAIDLIGGRCVRLSEGDYARSKVYDASPLDMALRYRDCGIRRIHLVDLDGAREGAPRNLRVLEELAARVDCELEWGGGLATEENLTSAFSAGATQAVIGSIAALQPETFRRWLRKEGPARMVLGADIRQGKVAVKGWLEETPLGVCDLVDRFLPDGLNQLICTDISRDGMLGGASEELYCDLQARYPTVDVTVSGGIASMEDIRRLDRLGLRRVITGKAVYEGRITLEELKAWSQNA